MPDDKSDPWRHSPLGPQQLLVSDVHYSADLKTHPWKLFTMKEHIPADLVANGDPHGRAQAFTIAFDTAEAYRHRELEREWAWTSTLRMAPEQSTTSDDVTTCRWIHVSSTVPKYISGLLWGLSDIDRLGSRLAESLRRLAEVIEQRERYSKHGRQFPAFFESLNAADEASGDLVYPLLICVPFMDWSVQGDRPPLRFQIDKAEARPLHLPSHPSSARHPLRSILQYFYRLEETHDREKDQVLNRHRPWTTDRELDLRVRSWYGRYPTSLVVDELWVLVVDATHIVTFASNQSWKSVYPPLQLPFRIKSDAFRARRSSPTPKFHSEPALTHTFICLEAALGLLHRSFWQEIILCLTDRYAGYLEHLQYRIIRAPNTRLVMDLLQLQEELNTVVKLIDQQLTLVKDLSGSLSSIPATDPPRSPSPRPDAATQHLCPVPTSRSRPRSQLPSDTVSKSSARTPGAPLLAALASEHRDLHDLLSRTDALLDRTIRLVNIRLEDHGRAILVFTVVTLVFLPLNFVSSFFGMNVSDVRDMAQGQGLFWIVAACVTVATLALSLALAFSGSAMLEALGEWRDGRARGKMRDGRASVASNRVPFWRRVAGLFVRDAPQR